MKKGDIVKLKKQSRDSLSYSAFDMVAYYRLQKIKNDEDIPEFFTVKEVKQKRNCGRIIDTISFDELSGLFTDSYFEVVLEAGEPDITELIKEEVSEYF